MATRSFDSPLFDRSGFAFSGAALMQAGLVLLFPMPDSLFLIEGKRI